jgi:DNA polymerase delta subunit 3
MADEPDLEPVVKPKKKRVKKVIPVGSNGLKKKRVMKSRTKVDDKGYMGELQISSSHELRLLYFLCF